MAAAAGRTRATGNATMIRTGALHRLVAGSSMPIFMPAVQKNGARYADPEWIKDANLGEAVSRGAEEI